LVCQIPPSFAKPSSYLSDELMVLMVELQCQRIQDEILTKLIRSPKCLKLLCELDGLLINKTVLWTGWN